MSGKDVVVLGDMMDTAPPPDSHHQTTPEVTESTSKELPRSSSPDPINLIRNAGTSKAKATDPIVVDDDDIEVEVEEVVRLGQLRPGTPNQKTMFRVGNVQEKVQLASSQGAAKQSPRQSTLSGYLGPQTEKPSSFSSYTLAARSRGVSSSEGKTITPGFTRKPTKPVGVVKSMKPKVRQCSGLFSTLR